MTTMLRRQSKRDVSKNRTQVNLNLEQRLKTVVQSVVGHISLIMGCAGEVPLGCVIERDPLESSPTYRLYVLSQRKFLLAARKCGGGFSDFAISTNPRLIGTGNKYFVARLSSNLFATEWVLRDAGYLYTGTHYIDSSPK